MNLEDYFSGITFDTEKMVKTIMEWSNVNSGSFNLNGLEKMATLLTQAFSVLDCEKEVHQLPLMEEVNDLGFEQQRALGPLLRFWKRPDAPFQVLLVGHMDTVFDKDHAFQVAIRKDNNIIQGPGVTDMKGGICVMLEALKYFEKSPVASQLGWEVIINPDEELGSFGSGPLLEERAKKHHVGLLFEPAMDEKGTVANIRKGSGNFVFVVHGKASHAGRDFDKGRNAIVVLSQIITAVDALNGKQEGVTLNIGQIQGGGAVNVVPPLAIARLDVRIQRLEDQAFVLENLKTIVKKANNADGFAVLLKGGFNRIPKVLTDKNQALYDLLVSVGQSLGQTIGFKPSGGCCDGNNLSAVSLPNIDTLGVCGGNIHSDQEYLLIDSLVPRVKLVLGLLLRLSI